jgi:hypothetical protein
MLEFWDRVFRNVEGGAGTGGEPAGGDAGSQGSDAGSVLYPEEGGKSDAGDSGAPEWKEYVADPNKSDEENATAKAEHDKTKPGSEKDGDGKKDGDDPADKVPEDGKYDLKMPEGVEIDQALLDALGPEFKEFGLTTKQAQKLADKFVESQQAKAKQQAETWGKTVSGWAEEAKADEEIGGDKWSDTVKHATSAIDKYGTPALKEYLDSTGGGNHPEVIRLASKLGARIAELEAKISEDDPGEGEAAGGKVANDAASTLYPDDTPKKG